MSGSGSGPGPGPAGSGPVSGSGSLAGLTDLERSRQVMHEALSGGVYPGAGVVLWRHFGLHAGEAIHRSSRQQKLHVLASIRHARPDLGWLGARVLA